MLKVLKFGGSSLADARQFAKVKSIVEADPARRVVIVSAPGKRFSGDHKITDLLYLCAAHIKYGVSCEDIFAMIRDRYNEIIAECGLHISLDKEFDALWDKMKNGISQDELASRGEYFGDGVPRTFNGEPFEPLSGYPTPGAAPAPADPAAPDFLSTPSDFTTGNAR